MSERANKLTGAIINFLNLNGFHAWRQNNIAAPNRKFHGRRGVPDVVGFHKKSGVFIGVEVKIGDDKLSLDQIQFALDAIQSRAWWFLAYDSLDGFIEDFNSSAYFMGDDPRPVVSQETIYKLEAYRQKLILNANNKRNRSNKTQRKRRS